MIEYVTKNEETDELELKPISYGIPQDPIKERFFLDYSKTELVANGTGASYTASSDGWINISMDMVAGTYHIYVNGVEVYRNQWAPTTWATAQWTGPLRRGDVATFLLGPHGGTINISFTPYG